MLERRNFLKLACASLSLSALPGCGSQEDTALLVPSTSSPSSTTTPPGPSVVLNRVLAFDVAGVAYLLEPALYRLSRLDSQGAIVWQIGDPSRGDGLFNVPVNLESDASGRLYVVDEGNAEIDVISNQGVPLRVIGRGQLRSLGDIAIDITRQLLYASEGVAHRISVFSLDGQLLRRFGSKGSGPTQLNSPDGVDVGPDGLLHVADCGNARVQVFNQDGVWQRSYGRRGTELGQLNLPGALVITSTYQVFVTDAVEGFVTQFDANGQPVSRFIPTLPDGRQIQPEHLHLTPDNRLLISGTLAFAGSPQKS